MSATEITATITQSDTDWNTATITIGTDGDLGWLWIESTAHTYSGDDVDFDAAQWLADIDAALSPEWKRTSDLITVSDLVQTCTVVAS